MQEQEREDLFNKLMEQVKQDFEYLKKDNLQHYVRIVGEIERVYRQYVLASNNIKRRTRYIDPNGEDDVESK
jgi:hypothetical protein